MRIIINGAGIAGPTPAYWLRKAGQEVLLVEAAPQLRRGGYVIDFGLVAYDIAEKMGLIPGSESWVTRCGRCASWTDRAAPASLPDGMNSLVVSHAEGFKMSYTIQDFTRDFLREKLGQLSSKDRKQLLRSLPLEDRREILQVVSPEERRQLLQAASPEERLAGLSAQEIRRYLDQLTAGRPSRPRKARRKK